MSTIEIRANKIWGIFWIFFQLKVHFMQFYVVKYTVKTNVTVSTSKSSAPGLLV